MVFAKIIAAELFMFRIDKSPKKVVVVFFFFYVMKGLMPLKIK